MRASVEGQHPVRASQYPERSRLGSLDVGGRLGFTVLELSLTVALTFIVLLAVARTLGVLDDIREREIRRAELVLSSRLAGERWARELRLARSVSVAESDALEFIADFGDGDVSVRYAVHDPGDDGVPPLWLYRVEGGLPIEAGQPVLPLIQALEEAERIPIAPLPRFEFRYYPRIGARLEPPLDAEDLAALARVVAIGRLENHEPTLVPDVPHASFTCRWSATIASRLPPSVVAATSESRPPGLGDPRGNRASGRRP